MHSHLPYVSSRVRSDNDEDWHFTERRDDGLIGYPLQTKPGISGGAVVVKDCIVGNMIHTAIFFKSVPMLPLKIHSTKLSI